MGNQYFNRLILRKRYRERSRNGINELKIEFAK